ncbi:MAG: hypothetical protein AB7K71_25275 [Polyangiaceae bacterium]
MPQLSPHFASSLLVSASLAAVGCSSLIGLDDFKAAPDGSGGTAGTSASGGDAGTSAAGGTSGNGGSGGVGGTGAAGATGGTGAAGATGGTGATAGTGGAGGVMHDCTTGPVTDLGSTSRNEGPKITIARCATSISYVIVEDAAGLEIYALTYGTDASPLLRNYSYTPGNFPRVGAATCTADELRLLMRDESGMAELVFLRTGNDLNTPLSPARTDIDTSSCTELHDIVGSYNGTTAHYAVECLEGSQYDLYYGPPFTKYATVSTGSKDRPYFYAYSGGIHLILTEEGKAWRGADATQLATLRQFDFEDPVNRPTAFVGADSNAQGFTLVGFTRAPAPNLLPGRMFSGNVAPSEIDEVFVGGSLPSSVKQRFELTSPDELGPISALSSGAFSSAFSLIGQTKQIRLTTMDSAGAVLVPSFVIRDVQSDASPVETHASPADDGSNFRVVWVDVDGSGKYAVRTRGALCL